MEKVKVKIMDYDVAEDTETETDVISPDEAIRYVLKRLDDNEYNILTISYVENFPYDLGFVTNSETLTLLNTLQLYNDISNYKEYLNVFDAYFKNIDFGCEEDLEKLNIIITAEDYLYYSNPEHNEYKLAVDLTESFGGPKFASFDALVKYFDFDNYMECVAEDPNCERFADAVDNRDRKFLATYFDYEKYGEDLVHSGTFVESKDGYVHFGRTIKFDDGTFIRFEDDGDCMSTTLAFGEILNIE